MALWWPSLQSWALGGIPVLPSYPMGVATRAAARAVIEFI